MLTCTIVLMPTRPSKVCAWEGSDVNASLNNTLEEVFHLHTAGKAIH